MRNPRLIANGRPLVSAVCLMVILLAVGQAGALDLFTLWKQKEIPLSLESGSYVDYRTQVMASGRREEGLLRVVCLEAGQPGQADPIVLELLPLEELEDGTLRPLAGNGARVTLDPSIRDRDGSLLDAVRSVRHWQDGSPRDITAAELRDDPLVSTSFVSTFTPDTVENRSATTRIVAGRQFTCRQWILASSDTLSRRMPAGEVQQISQREVAAAVHEDVPFLGLVYASERVRSVASLDPPNPKVPLPPDRIRVEVMELVGFGRDAAPSLEGAD